MMMMMMRRCRGESLRQWFRQRWGWIVVVAGFVVEWVSYSMLFCYGILLVKFQREFDASTVAVGWVGSVGIGISCATSIIANPLVERIGNRLVVIIGIVMCSMSLLLTSFMPSLEPMYFTYSILYGLGAGLHLFGALNLVLQYFPVHNSTRGVTFTMSGANIGTLCMAPLLQYMVDVIEWRNALRVFAAIQLSIGLPLTWTFDPPRLLPTPAGELGTDPEKEVETDSGIRELKKNLEPLLCDDIKRREESEDKYGNVIKDANRLNRDISNEVQEVPRPIGNGSDPDKVSKRHDTRLEVSNSPPIASYHLDPERMDVQKGKNNQYHITDKTVSGSSDVEEKTDLSRVAPQTDQALLWRVLVALSYPDLWMFCMATFGYGACASFFYVHLVRYVTSVGFSEEQGAQAVVAMGFSTLAGKFLLSSVAEVVPFPKFFFFLVASVMGIVLSFSIFFISTMAHVLIIISITGLTVVCISDTLPYSVCNLVFGVDKGLETWTVVTVFHGAGYLLASMFGKSVDLTGSYNGAIWATIVIYAVSGALCLLVPVYQRVFARGRFFMMSAGHDHGCGRSCHRGVAITRHYEIDAEGMGHEDTENHCQQITM